MSTNFYKKYWGKIGSDVIKEVQDFFFTGILNISYNNTFVALIPKVPSACRVEHFMPISLCNMIYKIITKIITSRLRRILEKIIHPSQAAFIPN